MSFVNREVLATNRHCLQIVVGEEWGLQGSSGGVLVIASVKGILAGVEMPM